MALIYCVDIGEFWGYEMNFVKLTLNNGRTTFVNLTQVCEVLSTTNGMTLIAFSNGESSIVVETPEQIINWIKTGKLE